MSDRRRSTGDRRPRAGAIAVTLALITVLVGACGTAASPGAPAASLGATASSSTSTSSAIVTFPPSQTPIAPGTYSWVGFERVISVTVGPGWALGHDNPRFFDLFRGSQFPSVSFARFTDVYVDGTTRATAVDAATVAATLLARADVAVSNDSAIELGGLRGRQFDLVTLQPGTPLFFGPAGDFKLEPTFKTRYRVLDFPGGGVLVIGIHAHADAFDAGISLGDPVLMTLVVEP
jgi:hypothetical protein